MGGGIPAVNGEGFRLLKGRDSGNGGRDSGCYPLVINRLRTVCPHCQLRERGVDAFPLPH